MMYNKILIATDGSEIADKALSHGIALAKELESHVSVVTVSEMWSALEMAHDSTRGRTDPIGDYEALATAAAKKVLDRAGELAKAQGIRCEPIHVADKHPAEGIIGVAQKIGADLIVIGSHGRRGVSRLLLGSQANEVVTLSNVPVLIVR
jgi:nucleotide-binding universal stress UspA family protein